MYEVYEASQSVLFCGKDVSFQLQKHILELLPSFTVPQAEVISSDQAETLPHTKASVVQKASTGSPQGTQFADRCAAFGGCGAVGRGRGRVGD